MNVQGKIRSPKIQATLKNLEPTPAFLYPQYPVNTQKWRAFWCEEVISTRSLVRAHLTSGFLPLLPSFWDREHHYIIQAALNPLAWASWVLGLQACSTRYPLNPSPRPTKFIYEYYSRTLSSWFVLWSASQQCTQRSTHPSSTCSITGGTWRLSLHGPGRHFEWHTYT